MTSVLEGDEVSASLPGHILPPGKNRYPLYRRLGGPHGRSEQVGKIYSHWNSIPEQHVGRRYTHYATRPGVYVCMYVCMYVYIYIYYFCAPFSWTNRYSLLFHFLVFPVSSQSQLSVSPCLSRNTKKTHEVWIYAGITVRRWLSDVTVMWFQSFVIMWNENLDIDEG